MAFFSNYQPNDQSSKESGLWVLFLGRLCVFIVPSFLCGHQQEESAGRLWCFAAFPASKMHITQDR